MEKIVFNVPGISCGHCVNTIEMEIGDLDGVQSVKGDVDTRTVSIEFGDPATEQLLVDLLKEINYPVQTN